jgi:dTDP-4-amino-4,6-dideoxygalactose transaminase
MSTALAVTAVGATPVLTDIDERSYGIDPEDARRRMTRRTKAILPVHLYGQVCDIEGVRRLAAQRRLTVIEDCAQAIGATAGGQAAGTFGAAGCFSFYPTKNLGAAGDGGAVVTSDRRVAKALRLVRNYGTENKLTYVRYGRNSRLDELQAAILLVKLRSLDRWIQARRQRAGWYREAFAAAGLTDVRLPEELPGRRHAYHLFVVRVPRRDRILRALQQQGIQAMAHYPYPLHRHSIYAGQAAAGAPRPRAEQVCREVLSLPVHPGLAQGQVDEVVGALKALLRGSTRRPEAARA